MLAWYYSFTILHLVRPFIMNEEEEIPGSRRWLGRCKVTTSRWAWAVKTTVAALVVAHMSASAFDVTHRGELLSLPINGRFFPSPPLFFFFSGNNRWQDAMPHPQLAGCWFWSSPLVGLLWLVEQVAQHVFVKMILTKETFFMPRLAFFLRRICLLRQMV